MNRLAVRVLDKVVIADTKSIVGIVRGHPGPFPGAEVEMIAVQLGNHSCWIGELARIELEVDIVAGRSAVIAAQPAGIDPDEVAAVAGAQLSHVAEDIGLIVVAAVEYAK